MTKHRLRESTSPYLQQHADNPVDWWPWCDEALERARRTESMRSARKTWNCAW
jgi:uncharacterized protein YyaL (SSP411 family)